MLEKISIINYYLSLVVCGPMIQFLLIGTGLIFSIKTGFLQIFKFKTILKKTLCSLFCNSQNKSNGSISSFQALTTALAGTLGTGNIVGTATAIAIGGPGALFWIVFSSFFGMMTKYAEIALSIKYRIKKADNTYVGGPMYYMRYGLNNKALPFIFCIIGIISSLCMGNFTQINSISSSLYATFKIKPFITGIIVAFFVGLIIIGDAKRIANATEKIVPFLALFYLTITIICLIANRSMLINSIVLVFKSAFSKTAAVGGFVGSTFRLTLKQGVTKGIFTNEAGLGSSPIAHSMANTNSPVEQGMWGIFEVFIDTILVCSCTGLVIISSGQWSNGQIGAQLAIDSYASGLKGLSPYAISISIFFLAFSSLITWSFYGEKFLEYLVKTDKYSIYYKIIFLIFIVIGANIDVRLVWEISDTLNCLMMLPNIICLLFLSNLVKKITKNYFS